MQKHMTKHGVKGTEANYDSAIFTSKNYKVVDQDKKGATIDEGEGEAVAGPARLLRFMPRDLKNSKTTKGSGKQGTTASGSSSSSGTLQLAKGYTITLKRDPNAKKFPVLKRDECPTKPTFGKKPKVIPSTGSAGSKKPKVTPSTGSTGSKKPNSGGK